MRLAGEDELDALMARLADGDRAAFEPLFVALHPRALRAARSRVGVSLAPDIAQATLMKLFAHAGDFTPGRAVLPWFYAVLANELRAARRVEAPARAERASDGAELADESEGADEALVRRELEVALVRAVSELDEVSADAIAALLGREERPAVTPQVFRKRVSRAYARLRILLGGYR